MKQKLKWTIKGRLEIVYTGTLKAMVRYSGYARLVHSDGSLYAEGECVEGVKVGHWRHYHNESQLMLDVTYDDKGREQGICRDFYENGQLARVCHYHDGKLQGESQTWYRDGALESQNWYDNDNSVEVKEFYPDGVMRLHQEFTAGRLSKETWYKPDGSVWRYQEYEKGRVVKEEHH